jgi:hypothetical protein
VRSLSCGERAILEQDGPVEPEPSFADGGIVRRHTARWPLSCDDCPSGRGIRPGERYSIFVGLTDDEYRDFFCERHCDGMSDECRAALPQEERPAPAPARHVHHDYDPDNIPF